MISEEERIAELIRALEDEKIIDSVARALGEIGSAAIPALKKAYKDNKDLNQKVFIIKALRNMGRDSVPLLINLLQNENEYWARIAIIRAFGKMGKEAQEAVPQLFIELELLDEFYSEKVKWALKEMSGISNDIAKNVLEHLGQAFFEKKIAKKVRKTKVKAYVEAIKKHPVQKIIKILKSRDETILEVYYRSLSNQYNNQVLQELVKLLENEDEVIRLRVVIAFRVIGKKAKEVIPYLERAIQCESKANIKFEIVYTMLIIEGIQGTAKKELEQLKEKNELKEYQKIKIERQIKEQLRQIRLKEKWRT